MNSIPIAQLGINPKLCIWWLWNNRSLETTLFAIWQITRSIRHLLNSMSLESKGNLFPRTLDIRDQDILLFRVVLVTRDHKTRNSPLVKLLWGKSSRDQFFSSTSKYPGQSHFRHFLQPNLQRIALAIPLKDKGVVTRNILLCSNPNDIARDGYLEASYLTVLCESTLEVFKSNARWVVLNSEINLLCGEADWLLRRGRRQRIIFATRVTRNHNQQYPYQSKEFKHFVHDRYVFFVLHRRKPDPRDQTISRVWLKTLLR